MILRTDKWASEAQMREVIVCDKVYLSVVSASWLLCDKNQSSLIDETDQFMTIEFFLESLASGREGFQVQKRPLPAFTVFKCLQLNMKCHSGTFWGGICCCLSAASTKIRNPCDLWPSSSVSVDLLYLYTDTCVRYLVYQMLTGEWFVVYKRP